MSDNKVLIFASIIITLFTWLTGYTIWASMCIPVFVLFLMIFIRNLANTIPFRELAMVVSSLQLLVSSFMAFYIQDPNPIFKPKGSPDDYFNFAVPGILLFCVGLFAFKPHQKTDQPFVESLQKYDLFAIGKQMILTGWVAFLINPYIPGSISYFATLLVFLSYTGGIMILFSAIPRSQKWGWVGLAFLPVIRDALFSGVFFLAMIWIAYLAIYFLFRSRKSIFTNFIIIVLGIYVVIVTDTAKKDYRSLTAEKGLTIGVFDKALLFGSLFIDNASFKTLSSETNVSARITRANQGALVTWVMAHTPKVQPFGEGETIKEAVLAAIFPRFLMPNKAKAGGRENFTKYTGHKLDKGTSMNLSLLGEGWANYGYWGGLIFMFAVGVFYSFAFRLFSSLMKRYPLYFFFIPFIFIYAIKAEDDLLTPMNHLAKASMVLFVVHHFYIKKINTVL